MANTFLIDNEPWGISAKLWFAFGTLLLAILVGGLASSEASSIRKTFSPRTTTATLWSASPS